MVAVICRIIIAVFSLVYMISGSNFSDLTAKYLYNLSQISAYENTTATAIGARHVYDIIDNHFASELPEGKTVKKAIFIGYDGMRADLMGFVSDENSAIGTVLGDGGHAYLSYSGGINYPYYNIQATDSGPNWTTMLTGEIVYKHGVLWNEYVKNSGCPTLFVSLIENGYADSTACYTSWGGFPDTILSEEQEYAKANNLNITYDHTQKENDDVALRDMALADISREDCSDFLFTMFESTDEGGDTGFTTENPDYVEAFHHQEALADSLIDAIKARPTYDTEDWLIIISADHGGFIDHHGYCSAQERYTCIVVSKELGLKDLY